LVLKPVVAAEEQAVVAFKWDAKLFVIPECCNAFLNGIALGDFFEVISCELVLFVNPLACLV